MLASVTEARRRSGKVPQTALQVVTEKQRTEGEPLFLEITPAIASDLIAIYDYMPKTEEEAPLEEVVAMAVSYFRSRLEQGMEVLSREERDRMLNARRRSQEGP